MTWEHLRKLREILRKAAESLSDADGFNAAELFEPWAANMSYAKDKRLQYGGELYKVLQDHTSQEDWTPDVAVSLYVKVPDPAIEWPEWVQPTGAHDAYAEGAKVSHNDKHWISTMNANTYEPGVYGWEEQA